jgi:hypothetical protein
MSENNNPAEDMLLDSGAGRDDSSSQISAFSSQFSTGQNNVSDI